MRKEYTKPMVTQVHLVLGEAVLAGCKSVTTYIGPVQCSYTYDTCSAASCYTDGS